MKVRVCAIAILLLLAAFIFSMIFLHVHEEAIREEQENKDLQAMLNRGRHDVHVKGHHQPRQPRVRRVRSRAPPDAAAIQQERHVAVTRNVVGGDDDDGRPFAPLEPWRPGSTKNCRSTRGTECTDGDLSRCPRRERGRCVCGFCERAEGDDDFARAGVRTFGPLPYRTACWAPDALVPDPGGKGAFPSLRVDPAFVAHVRSLPAVPRKLHILWTERDIFSLAHVPLVRHGVVAMRDLNPGWKVVVHDAAAVDAYLARHLPKHDWRMIRGAPFVPKSDIWRFLLMYHDGGFYQDVDRVYSKPMKDVLHDFATKLALPMFMDVTFVSDMLLAAPGNRLFARMVDIWLCKMREQAGQGLLQWGKLDPAMLHTVEQEAYGAFYAAVMEVVFGGPVWGPAEHKLVSAGGRSDHGAAFANVVRARIAEHAPLLVTQREDTYKCRTLVADVPHCKGVVSKKALWTAVKLKQWDRSSGFHDRDG